MRTYNVIFQILRYILIVLFIYTGVSKFIGYYLFLSQLSDIIFLQKMAGFISIFIPLIEIAAGIALAFQKTEIIGWWLCAVLLSGFSIYVSMMLLFAPHLPCSCGGIIAALSWTQHLIINILLGFICWIKLYRHYLISKFSMHTRE